jgi:hypothetical protein
MSRRRSNNLEARCFNNVKHGIQVAQPGIAGVAKSGLDLETLASGLWRVRDLEADAQRVDADGRVDHGLRRGSIGFDARPYVRHKGHDDEDQSEKESGLHG